MQCDAVIKAIVEKPDYSFLPGRVRGREGQAQDRRGQPRSGACGAGVFAGGDFVTGPATVAAGHQRRPRGGPRHRPLPHGRGRPSPSEARTACSRRRSAPSARASDGSCLQPSGRVEVAGTVARASGSGASTSRRPARSTRRPCEAEADRCFNCGCVAVNSSDLAPALIALGAKVKTTQRIIAAEDFFAVGVNTQHGARRRRDGARGPGAGGRRRARSRPSSSSPSASPSTSRW